MKKKRFTFNELKTMVYNEHMELRKELCDKNNEDDQAYLKQATKEYKEEFKQMKTLDDLVNFLQGEGFKDYEVYELLLGHVVKLPK